MGWHNDAEAKRLLTDAAAQVQPIMRKRGWIVPLLTEFYPPNACLLGLNIGGGGGRTREVRVRLRQARDRTLFYPFEHVLGTLLHELVHNVQGPHNSVFYKLLDELNDECDELMAKGITGSGAGFHGPSKGRLGSHAFVPLHNPPSTVLREVAARAAEERAKKQRLMTRGPCCVGRASGQASGAALGAQ
ncbi:WLM domain-containing protein, partial [Haematococcus lacustris]